MMARSGGFEPPTAWFVARYSIQLSYERTFDGGEGGIRTLDTGQTVYSLSRGAPSATRPPHRNIINMARPGGFEPPTAWFVARYSIQLSYGR